MVELLLNAVCGMHILCIVMKMLRKKYLLVHLGFLLITLLYVLHHMYLESLAARRFSPRRQSYVKRLRFNGSFEHVFDGSFVSALTALADADRCIVLAMIDKAFVDMAINFHEATLLAHRIQNFLFVGVGRDTCEILANLSIPCFYYADDPDADTPSSYGEMDFKRKMNIRTDMILEALAANFTVIHTDTDVAFLSNPLTEIKA